MENEPSEPQEPGPSSSPQGPPEKRAAKEKKEERRRLIEELNYLEFEAEFDSDESEPEEPGPSSSPPQGPPDFEECSGTWFGPPLSPGLPQRLSELVSDPPGKRKSSLDAIPPNLSELRVVLLGNSSSERMKVKDLLLSASEGVTEISSRDCWKYEFKIEERDVHVINPKDLLGPDVSQAEVEEDVQTAQRLSAPGAHVLLLVLQPEDFTEDQKEKLCSVLRLFGERSFDHSLILISTPREESPGFMEFRKHPPLKDLIRMCKYRYLWFKDLEVEELLTRFDQIVRENDGEHLKPSGSVSWFHW